MMMMTMMITMMVMMIEWMMVYPQCFVINFLRRRFQLEHIDSRIDKIIESMMTATEQYSYIE